MRGEGGMESQLGAGLLFFFSSRRRHTVLSCDWSSDVCSSDLFVIFFIPDPTAALREWRRVLAPGGRMAIATWGGADPRWAFERAIRRRYIGELDPALLQDLGRGLALLERFTAPEKVAAELREGGLDDIEVVEHQIEFVFCDERDWWEWNFSHANRRFFEGMPAEAFERMRTEVEAAMQQVRDERGFPRTYTALLARCRESDR